MNAATTQPRYGLCRSHQTGLLQQGIVGPLVQPDNDSFGRDLDHAWSIDELPKQRGRARLCEAFQSVGQVAVSRSASTVSVRSKSTFRRTSLHKQSRWKNVICSPS